MGGGTDPQLESRGATSLSLFSSANCWRLGGGIACQAIDMYKMCNDLESWMSFKKLLRQVSGGGKDVQAEGTSLVTDCLPGS